MLINFIYWKLIRSITLIFWAEEYNVYVEAQDGFSKGMSTVDNVFILHGLISHSFTNKTNRYCAFIDFTKAFDFVVKDVLWYKLIKLGVRGKLLNVIKFMYSRVKPKVKHMNTL